MADANPVFQGAESEHSISLDLLVCPLHSLSLVFIQTKEEFKVDQVTDDIGNIKKLQAGRIDGIPSDDLALIALAKNSGVEFDSLEKLIKLDKLSGGLSMAFSLKTSDETVEKCRVALESMVKDGTFDSIAAK